MKEETTTKKLQSRLNLNFLFFSCINERQQRQEAFHVAWNVLLDSDWNISPWTAKRKSRSQLRKRQWRRDLCPPTWCACWCAGGCLHRSPSNSKEDAATSSYSTPVTKHVGPLGGKYLHLLPLRNSLCKPLPANPGYGSPRSPYLLHWVTDALGNTFPLA